MEQEQEQEPLEKGVLSQGVEWPRAPGLPTGLSSPGWTPPGEQGRPGLPRARPLWDTPWLWLMGPAGGHGQLSVSQEGAPTPRAISLPAL